MEEFKLYSVLNTKDTIFECWGSSTKHPDAIFHFSNFKKSMWAEEDRQIIPWLFQCASKMNFPYHSKQIAKFALSLDKYLILYYNKYIKEKKER